MADHLTFAVTGADDLRRALRATSDGLDEHVRAQFLDQARMVAADAAGHVPRQSGAARATVDAVILDQAATIVGGGGRVPYFPWLEYGGRVGRHQSVRRPFVRDGRYIGRAVDAAFADIEAAAARGVADAARGAGLEVT